MEKNKFTHGSLFSGIGGPEIAAEEMGWKNMFHCEINPFGRKILDYWFPNSKSYEDITKTNFTEWRGKINVLTGGFPCQPFSCAGQRKGAEDDRYLWPEMLRAIREIQPDWVVGENVAGILSMVQPGSETALGREESLFGEVDRKRILHRQEYVVETVCNDLEREGYSVQPLLIPACAVGAPHRRDRVWFVAHRTDARLEDVRRTREDDILSAGNVTDSNSKKLQERIKVRRRKNQEKAGTRVDDGVERFGNMRYAPYSDNERLQVFNISQRNDAEKRKIEERYLEQYSSDVRRALHSTPWDDFPTQSPVCRGNDGVPVNVDNLTIPFTKWRQESIKGYGNAIVPQVILEIFKAIEEIEQSE
jgi:DNA (cytosine-5)-methyltransferase 1